MDLKAVFSENNLKEMLGGQLDSFLREEAKIAFTHWLYEKAIPTLEDFSKEYIGRLKEASQGEQGWCKVRDSIVLPLAVEGGLWLITNALEKVVEEG